MSQHIEHQAKCENRPSCQRRRNARRRIHGRIRGGQGGPFTRNQPQRQGQDDGTEDNPITVRDLITAMDGGLLDLGLIPFYFSETAKREGCQIVVGSCIALARDPLNRQFVVSKIDPENQSVRVRDDEQNVFQLPWDLVEPWRC